VTDQQARYDRIAEGYARWWAPVIRPAAVRILDRIAPLADRGPLRILEVGTGTGTLAIEAIRRWPEARVDGIDPSGEMTAAARGEADRLLDATDRGRFDVTTALADRLPFDDETFDAAVSSFVLQLVPDRYAALREVRRVLRPGGRFAHVTWLAGGQPFEPDRVLDEVLDEAGYGPREPEDGGGDYPDPQAAAAGLRRAGFRHVVAEGEEFAHAFDVEGYAGFIEEFDEEDLFASFGRTKRARVGRRLREAVAALPAEALVMRAPIVYAYGDRS
jgi:ubiquinone/menaquinone biosynthesis C-methylase UbiE